jgi:hypothetical protein
MTPLRLLPALLLAASCTPAQIQQLQLTVPSPGTTYEPGQAIDFGTVTTTAPRTVTLQLTNNGPASAVLTGLSVDGAVFQLGWAGRNPLGTTLSVGQSVEFTITFSPVTAGPAHLGELWVQAAVLASPPEPILQPQAEYDLVGAGAGPAILSPRASATPTPTPDPTSAPTPTPTPAPAWPKATIAATPALASDEEVQISIAFDAPLPADGAGTLTVSPGQGYTGDSQMGFITANGAFAPRAVSFTLTKSETTAEFAGAHEIKFQTGTTACTLTFTATLGDGTPLASQEFTIAPAQVGIDSVGREDVAGTITVMVDGFDNTRTASQVTFTFSDTFGHQIGQPILVDATAPFQSYFPHAGTGLFELTQAFSVAGNVSDIGSVAVKITNAVGTSAPIVSK